MSAEEPAGTTATSQPTLSAELGGTAGSPGPSARVSPSSLPPRDRSIFPSSPCLRQDEPSACSRIHATSLLGVGGTAPPWSARGVPSPLLHPLRTLGAVHRDLPLPQVN